MFIKFLEYATLVVTSIAGVVGFFHKVYVKHYKPFVENIKHIQKQFEPNGGNSLVDKIDSITIKVSGMDNQLGTMNRVINSTLYLDPNPMFKTDAAGNYNFVNYAWLNLTGFTGTEEAQGTGWERSIYAEDRDMVTEEWERCIQTGSQFNMEYRYINRITKQVSKIQSKTTFIRDNEQKIIQIIGLIQTI